MTETAARIIQEAAAIGLAVLTVYQCWAHKMRLRPVATTALAGAAAWWALSPGVLSRIINLG